MSLFRESAVFWSLSLIDNVGSFIAPVGPSCQERGSEVSKSVKSVGLFLRFESGGSGNTI
jgi:hypothetical protein